jgi:hypothetical protein
MFGAQSRSSQPFDKLMAGGVEGPFDSVYPELVEGLGLNGDTQ